MSKKQMKQFVFTIIALAVCVIGYLTADYYSKEQKQREEEESAKKAEENTVVVYQMESVNNITGFAYVADGKTIMLVKDESGNWLDSEDSSVNLAEDTIESVMLTNLMYVSSDEVIEAPEDVNQYGFDNPTNQIVISMSDGTTSTFIVGAQNEFDTSKYYMMLEGDDNVYVIDSVIPNAFSKTVDELVEEETTVEETTVEETTAADSEKE